MTTFSMQSTNYSVTTQRNATQRTQYCIRCYRCKPTAQEQLIGDLPSERVTPTYPFLKTSVDLCGPLFYRHHGRKSPPVKCYVAIFVCLATKAVRIELVADLTTDAFISALKRFIARRSKPAVIECDNARNFQGASRALAELLAQFRSQQHQHSVGSFCVKEGIEFKFIPPRSPNFGGLWEPAVKSFKKHLKVPSLRWCLGRVTRLFFGDDRNVRVVSVRTKDGDFNRAISKVCVLLIQQSTRADEDVVLANM